MVLYTTQLFVQYIFRKLLQFATNIVTLKPVLQLMFTQCCCVAGTVSSSLLKNHIFSYKVMISRLYYL